MQGLSAMLLLPTQGGLQLSVRNAAGQSFAVPLTNQTSRLADQAVCCEWVSCYAAIW